MRMNTEKLIPEHPRPTPEEQAKRMERVAFFEKNDCPTFSQNEPLDSKAVYDEFTEQYDTAAEKYYEKRIEMVGVVNKIGPDIHGKPSIELSDRVGGHCYALYIFENDDFYSKVSVGDTVVCRGNLLRAREPFGAVIKKSELIEVRNRRKLLW